MKRLSRIVLLVAITVPGSVLIGAAALELIAITTASCAPKAPPNTYTAPVDRMYQATPWKQAILAFSQTAIAMNKATGQTHLSDDNTRVVRDFALSADATINSWVAGTGTLANVQTSLTTLLAKLTPDVKNGALAAALATLQAALQAIPTGGN